MNRKTVNYPSPPTSLTYKLDPEQRDEINSLIEECQNDLEAVLFRLVWQREHLTEALYRIQTGDMGDWGCQCPAGKIAAEAFQKRN